MTNKFDGRMQNRISSLLQIERGITAIIGSGGKTTLMYALANELSAEGSVILCTSTHIRIPEEYPLVTGGKKELVNMLSGHRIVCAGTLTETGEKLTAPAVTFEELSALADHVLVEADGAKGLPLKAHAAHEPVIPSGSRSVILVVGADGLGKPVKEACHRFEIWAALAQTAVEGTVTPEGEARVILTENLAGRIFINKAESAEEKRQAEALAALLPFPTVMGSLRQGVFTICH